MIAAIRLECDDGYGIFKIRENGFNMRDLPEFDKLAERHRTSFPSPITDLGIHEFNLNYYCAFKSFDSMLQWITLSELIQLIHYGVRVYKLYLKSAQIGVHQICFTKDSIVNKINLTDGYITNN
jgi:hypothetical protein